MKKIIIIGYGNPDREDDGVAWHVVMALAGHYGLPVPEDLLDGFVPEGNNIDFYTSLQLTPEMADTIAAYDAVCFVDAHTGAVPDDLNIKRRAAYFEQARAEAVPVDQVAFVAGCRNVLRTVAGEKYQAPDGSWQTRGTGAPLRDSRCP